MPAQMLHISLKFLKNLMRMEIGHGSRNNLFPSRNVRAIRADIPYSALPELLRTLMFLSS